MVILLKPESYTVQVALRQLQTQAYVMDFGIEMTGTFLATLPLLVVGLVLGRQLISGIMEGAVKG